MATLEILHFPDPRLRRRARPVPQVSEAVRGMLDDMLETMYDAKGVGLAATQVDIHLRMLVADVSDERDQPLYLVNPEIVARDGLQESEEGCLSVPGVYEPVRRAEQIRVRALGRDGEALEFDADGLLAVCIQHEIDHLDGKLFVDYLSELKRQRIRKKLQKQQRIAEPAGITG
ncbi:MAG: peptide deformylase [Pseudomonadota bacterium]|jgi:peptide deformylase